MKHMYDVCDLKSEFARTIRMARERRGITVNELARINYVCPKLLYDYEIGRKLPKQLASIITIADVYEIDVEDLILIALREEMSNIDRTRSSAKG